MNETDYRDHLCYKDSFHRQHATIGGLYNAASLFNKTQIYLLYLQIHEEMKAAQVALARNDFKTLTKLQAMSTLMHAKLSDNYLTGGCLELIAKSILLYKGVLIHKIQATCTIPLEIQRLAAKQKNEPVMLTEYFEAGGEFVTRQNKRRLKYVGDITIDYSVAYNDDYLSLIPLSQTFTEAAKKYRILRNITHFPAALGSEAELKAT
jgi:hypothetical protein